METIDDSFWMTRLWGASQDDIYAVGWKTVGIDTIEPAVFHFDGSIWEELDISAFKAANPTVESFAYFCGKSSNDMYLATSTEVFTFDGTNMSALPFQPSSNIQEMDCQVLSSVFAVIDSGVERLNEMGEWTQVSIDPSLFGLSNVHSMGMDLAMAVGGSSILAIENDIATSINGFCANNFDAVWVANEDDIFVTGSDVILQGSADDWELETLTGYSTEASSASDFRPPYSLNLVLNAGSRGRKPNDFGRSLVKF